MLDTTFEKLGLKREHSDVYLALLQGGIMPVGKLAKGLKFPRTTIYGLLDDLAKAGLVLQNEQNNVKLWQAIAPEGIKTIIKERINDLENTRSGFESMLESLKKSQKTDFVSPKFHYYEGADEMQLMFRDVLLYNDLQTEACWPIQDMLKVMGEEFLNEFNKKRVKSNIALRVVWPRDKTVDVAEDVFLAPGKEVLRQTRLAPKEMDFSMGYWAYADKVMFLSSRAENFGFIVESRELRQLIKTQFEILWNVSEELKVDPQLARNFAKEVGERYGEE